MGVSPEAQSLTLRTGCTFLPVCLLVLCYLPVLRRVIAYVSVTQQICDSVDDSLVGSEHAPIPRSFLRFGCNLDSNPKSVLTLKPIFFPRWLWTEAGAQYELENALGIGGFGYPAMAAINARKMKFALLKGSFSEQGINEFLR